MKLSEIALTMFNSHTLKASWQLLVVGVWTNLFMGKKNSHPNSGEKRPTPWDKVQVRNGKLVGMLTDELANTAMPKSGDGGSSSTLTTVGNLGNVKVHKRPPSKFK